MNTTGNIKKNSPTQVGALTANNPKFQYVVDEFNKEMGADEMKEEIKDELLGAIRQYRHNDNSGFVKVYDFDTVNQIVEKLLSQQREELKKEFIKMNQENIDNLKEAGRLIFDAVNDLDAQRAIAELDLESKLEKK